MPENQENPPFSVLLATCEALLKQRLLAAQYAVQQGLGISERFERDVKCLTEAIETLRTLVELGFKQARKPESYGEDCDSLRTFMADNNIVVDVVKTRPEKYHKKEDAFTYILYQQLWHQVPVYAKAKHLPLPNNKLNLRKVRLADGNTAWLKPKTLKQIRKLINSR